MKKNQDKNEDDGRTVADMSQVSGGYLSGRYRGHSRNAQPGSGEAFGGRRFGSEEAFSGRQAQWDTQGPQTEERPWENAPLTRKERWMYTLGAMKASLLIGLAYVAGLGILVGLMVFFWK